MGKIDILKYGQKRKNLLYILL